MAGRYWKLMSLVCSGVLLLGASGVQAQVFAPENTQVSGAAVPSSQRSGVASGAAARSSSARQTSAVRSVSSVRSVAGGGRQSGTRSDAGGQPGMPTLDGVPRGNVSIRPVASEESQFSDGEHIFLYYDNFSINKTLGGMVRCNVRFIVLTTLNRKLNMLNVKLKWPSMQTALSFNDVAPNVENYFDYTLVGNGCYSMDKIPNIIVNRCRVSKMTQEDCAAKILWLKKR